jgi:hypothetical protein
MKAEIERKIRLKDYLSDRLAILSGSASNLKRIMCICKYIYGLEYKYIKKVTT